MAQPIEESILKLEPGLLLAWEKLTSLTTSKHYKDTNMWLNDEREKKKKIIRTQASVLCYYSQHSLRHIRFWWHSNVNVSVVEGVCSEP